MKGKFLSWIRGSVRIRIAGGFCERFLNLCAYHDIHLWNLQPAENGYEAGMSLNNFRRLKPLARKCHIRIRILEKSGLPFFLFRNRKRKVLFLSLFAAFLLVFSLSFFIWDIEIMGNLSVTDEKIMDYLRKERIHQGVLKSSLDYKQLAADLRQFFPEITWVSVKLQGTRLLIDMKENEDVLEETEETAPCSLLCDVDGIIVQMVTRAGTPVVSVGTEVKKGDLLVSGIVELINDSGEVYDYQYVAADADIYVKTSVAYQDSVERKQMKKLYTGNITSRSLLKIGSLSIGIPFFGNSYEQYDCVTEGKQLRLMENFYLPVYFSRFTLREYRMTWQICSPGEAEEQLKMNLEKFLEKIQQKGVQIFQNNVKIETTDSVSTAKGDIYLIQKAGRRTALETQNQKEGTPAE